MKARIRVIVLFTVVLMYLAIPRDACACTCVEYDSIEEQIKENISTVDAIFIGTVTDIEEINEEELKITFSVSRVWKGPQYTLLVVETYNPETTAACGFPFQVGGAYIVFAYGSEYLLGTSTCTATSSVSWGYQNQVKEVLGEGVIPEFDNPYYEQPQNQINYPYIILGICFIEILLGICIGRWFMKRGKRQEDKS